MGKTERVPMESDEADHDEPFVGDTDHLRSRQDKSMQPHPGDADRPEMEERERPDREQRDVFDQADTSDADDADTSRPKRGGRAYVEQEAVRMLKDTLREKGVSESFIHENEEKIRKKALDHLYGRGQDLR